MFSVDKLHQSQANKCKIHYLWRDNLYSWEDNKSLAYIFIYHPSKARTCGIFRKNEKDECLAVFCEPPVTSATTVSPSGNVKRIVRAEKSVIFVDMVLAD